MLIIATRIPVRASGGRCEVARWADCVSLEAIILQLSRTTPLSSGTSSIEDLYPENRDAQT